MSQHFGPGEDGVGVVQTTTANAGSSTNGVRTLRRWLHAFRFTPFHPQFLAYRYERQRYRMTGSLSSGLVLDVGCGRQPLREHIATGCEYISIDHPGTGAWYEARPSIFGEAACLPFADETFDTVVCLEVLEHLARPDTALLEARRVLKPGGRLIISTPFLYPIHDAPADYHRWTSHGLELLAQSSGLQTESLIRLGTPVETGALLLNLGWAWQAVNASQWAKLPMVLLALLLIPFVNLLGLVLSRLVAVMDENPFAIGYISVLQARTD